jgi:hypothetical protein
MLCSSVRGQVHSGNLDGMLLGRPVREHCTMFPEQKRIGALGQIEVYEPCRMRSWLNYDWALFPSQRQQGVRDGSRGP